MAGSVAWLGRILLGLAVSSLFLCVAAEAKPPNWEYSTTPVGGSGDIQSAVVCPLGEYVVGFDGRVAGWIKKIDLRCAPVLPTGKMGQAHTVLGDGGDGGDAVKHEQCAEGVLRGLSVQLTNGNRMVFAVGEACTDPASGADLSRSNTHLYVTFGSGSGGVDSTTNPQCRSDMALTGLRVNFGKDVNAIGIICATFKIPRAPAAVVATKEAPLGTVMCQGGGMQLISGPMKGSLGFTFQPAPQGARAAAPAPGQCAWSERAIAASEPRKLLAPINLKTDDLRALITAAQKGGIIVVHATIKGDALWVTSIDSVSPGAVSGGQTASAGTKAAGLVAEPAASFVGDWNSEAGGVAYKINMRKDGPAIVGTFNGADGSSGDFSGSPNGNVLRFSWKQADGHQGTGKFVLADNGRSFTGATILAAIRMSSRASGTATGSEPLSRVAGSAGHRSVAFMLSSAPDFWYGERAEGV